MSVNLELSVQASTFFPFKVNKFKSLLDSCNPFLKSEKKSTAGGSQPKLPPGNPKLHIYYFCVKSFLLCHTTDNRFWSKGLCLSYPFLDEITVRFYSYHFRIHQGFMLMLFKEAHSGLHKARGVLLLESPTAGLLYAKNHCYSSSFSLSHSWNKGFSDKLYVF